MNYINILIAFGVLGALGLIFGLLLGFASRFFAPDKDDGIDAVLAALPGANCGACGFTGCKKYAAAIVKDGADISLCPVGGNKAASALATITGREAKKVPRLRAAVSCSGGMRAKRKYEYQGIKDCVAASKLGGGDLACQYGCLGLGSCVKVCEFDAIRLENGVAKVNHEKCTACGKCVAICPKQLISLVPLEATALVACSSLEKGSFTKDKCSIGCIGCKICVNVCKQKAITVENNKAEINQELCNHCGECIAKCPRKIIRNIDV